MAEQGSTVLDKALSCGIDEATATAVTAAFERLAQRTGRAFDPAGWSKTVWLAEADRWRRSANPDQHFSLLLHLNTLREQFEEKAARGARGWTRGTVGERLTKR